MNLDGALSAAVGGLAVVNRQMGLVSQNVANAGTPDYAVEVAVQTSVTAGSEGMGVRSGPTTRQIDTELQAEAFRQNTVVAGLQTRQAALQAIDSVQGTPGQGSDLPSLLGNLQGQFSTLLNQPDNQTQQAQVVSAATTLARSINTLTNACTTQRQAAQNDLSQMVDTLNTTLATIGSLSNRIVPLRVAGQSTADLENQRAAAVDQLSQLLDVKTLDQPNGDLLVITASGLSLPTHSMSNPVSVADAAMQPGVYYPGGGAPAVTVSGVDATARLAGGRIGADLTLRDSTLPTYQAELDEFAQSLASRFSAQGLTLFTDPSGVVPAPSPSGPVQASYVGFAATIQVNPLVRANPALVRDGTAATAGSPGGASSFTPNPSGGPAGFTTLINRVLTYTLGANVQDGVVQPAVHNTGLGANGSLNAPFASPPILADMAATMVASQAQDSADATSRLATEQAVQTGLNTRLSTNSGVNMDTEMSTMIALQNAYGANAKVLSTVQALFNQLLSAVQ